MTVATGLTRLPAVEGFFTMGDDPQLIGGRLETGGGTAFRCTSGAVIHGARLGAVEEVLLSRFGTIWSFTNSAYPPPPPFIVGEPYVPVVVAAVELAEEQMVVLGQVSPGWTVDDLEVGMGCQARTGRAVHRWRD
ncbi:MAG: benzoylsuccinyl-CoA thiolase [Acidimicrobiales bacterium]|nr:MAG: benzoylsuccinyl-CoA thiolase [Acidimicrobiales bacterium]